MNLRLIIRVSVALILIAGLWFAWWAFGRSPEAQVRAAQAKLIKAVEDRDWEEVADFFAPSYTDAYSHTRESAIVDGKKYLSGFFTLDIKTEQMTIQAAKDQGMVKTMLKLEGNGIGYSQLVLGHVNQLTEPWVFHWNKAGAWPWDWQVNMIHNDQVR